MYIKVTKCLFIIKTFKRRLNILDSLFSYNTDLPLFTFTVYNNAEIKEGSTVSMSCYKIETDCKSGCDVRWTVRYSSYTNQEHSVCTRPVGVDPSNTNCYVAIGAYSGRSSYIGGGVVHIKNIRRTESGVYYCQCKCFNGQPPVILRSNNRLYVFVIYVLITPYLNALPVLQ